MKRVLIFSVAYYPFVGGAEVAVREVTRRITDIEFHLVTVNLTGQEKSLEKIDNVYVYRVGRGSFGKFLLPFLGLRKALSLHKSLKFDAVWSIMANYAGFAALFFVFFRPKVKFILSLQEGDPIDHIKRRAIFVYPLFLSIFRKATVIHSISKYLSEVARNFGAKAPIHVIPNGVDVSLFTREYRQEALEVLKQNLGKGPNDRWLVTTSRLVWKNGIDTVLEALSLLPESIGFLIIGTGELEEELKKTARDLGVENRVIFLGFVHHEEMHKYLKISDIFVRPSRSEGMGNSFIEAMACGLPVIATRVGGIPDFLTDRETGLFCEVENPPSLAEDVLEILEDEEFRSKIIANGKKLALTDYGWDNIADQMKNKVFDLEA